MDNDMQEVLLYLLLVCYFRDIGIWSIEYLLLLVLLGSNKIIDWQALLDRQALIVRHLKIV